MYAGFIIAFILCFFTSLLNEENAGSLLSAYNTMSDERKKNVDFKGIVKIHKIVFYSISAYLVIISLINLFVDNLKFMFIAMILGLSWGFIPLFFLGSNHDKNIYKTWEIWFQRFMIAFLFFGGLIISYFIYTTPLNELTSNNL
ncbi:MAG: DUF3784 domain-containing protein [Myroides sp.]